MIKSMLICPAKGGQGSARAGADHCYDVSLSFFGRDRKSEHIFAHPCSFPANTHGGTCEYKYGGNLDDQQKANHDTLSTVLDADFLSEYKAAMYPSSAKTDAVTPRPIDTACEKHLSVILISDQ